MPFHSNTSQNTVIYSSPTWETKVLQNNLTLGASLTETAGIIDEFKTSIGKYERIIGEVNIFYTSTNANEFSFRFQNVDSDNAYVDTIFNYSVVACIGDVVDSNNAESANLEGGTASDAAPNNNTGRGAIIKLDANSDDSPLAATIKFSAIGNEGKNGTLSFQAGGVAGAPVLLAGSWINYKRF